MTKQNSGSAIVIVIVAMAFVGILASTLMWMSLMNFRMKVTERKVKESFYTAEMVFEQMVVGLQNLSSAAADQSYSFIMQNYANFPEQKRDAEFSKEYLKAVRMAISKSSVETNQYDLEKLMLYVDEAQNYKNLFLTTKMRNVAGLSTSEAQKSSDMLMKCRYLDELTGGRGVVFATGTPVSNSMTELFIMMRYLQHDLLVQKGLAHFDCWASTFGETVTAIELAPEGYTLVGR